MGCDNIYNIGAFRLINTFYKDKKVVDIEFEGDIFYLIFESGKRDFLLQDGLNHYIEIHDLLLQNDFSEFLEPISHGHFRMEDARR